MLMKIGEVAIRYDLSNRTLRYWEEVGILTSRRLENGYRYYDEANILKIKQIIMLRKLRLAIQDIQRIFVSTELSSVINILLRHLADTEYQIEELRALGVVLEHLIGVVKGRHNLAEVFQSLELTDNLAGLDFKNALQITLSERDKNMSEKSSYNSLGEVRIVSLPKMVFACYRTESSTPEKDCADVVNELILRNSLHRQFGFRHFGFNNPDPKEGNPVYGYEMWVVVPEDFSVPETFVRKEFDGGLFASIPAQLTIIGERWRQLWDWVMNHQKYAIDWNPASDRRWLEECIDYQSFNSTATDENDKQLDLLAPIKLKDEKIYGL